MHAITTTVATRLQYCQDGLGNYTGFNPKFTNLDPKLGLPTMPKFNRQHFKCSRDQKLNA